MPPDPLKPLRDAIDGLVYPSESDSPFEIVDWPDLSLPAGDELPPAEFFDPLKAVTDAPRFARLQKVLERTVGRVRFFRLEDGSAQVWLFLVGPTAWGRVVGVRTVSIET